MSETAIKPEDAPPPYTEDQIVSAVRQALQPLRIYDVATDKWRPATQADIDRLWAIVQAWGRAVSEVRRSHESIFGGPAT